MPERYESSIVFQDFSVRSFFNLDESKDGILANRWVKGPAVHATCGQPLRQHEHKEKGYHCRVCKVSGWLVDAAPEYLEQQVWETSYEVETRLYKRREWVQAQFIERVDPSDLRAVVDAVQRHIHANQKDILWEGAQYRIVTVRREVSKVVIGQ